MVEYLVAESDRVFLSIMHFGPRKCYNLNQCSSLTGTQEKHFQADTLRKI